MPTILNQPQQWPVRVYYEDTDAAGVVYHANYLKYFERARTEYVAFLYNEDLFAMQARIHRQFMVKSITVNYIKPAKLGDYCVVTTQVNKQTGARLFFDQVLRIKDTQAHICQAQVEVVCVTEQGKPCRLP